MQINPQSPVLVTGASGYVASWLVKDLLEQGYIVHGTVRDPKKAKGLAHLHALQAQFPGKLTLFKADLLTPNDYHDAMQGCELVIHMASPFVVANITDSEAQLIRPAVDGTKNVLNTVNNTPSVKRVVLTSSVVSIFGDNQDSQNVPNGVFDETHWNTTSRPDHQPYNYSKVMAEKAAWEIADAQSRWDLVTINPSFVMGPSLAQESQSTSISTMKQMGDGTMRAGTPRLYSGVVDVRDVARAHILAGFTPTAKGRYITSAKTVTFLDMANAIREKFPQYPLPRSEAPKLVVQLLAPVFGLKREFVKKNMNFKLDFNNQKSQQELALAYRPWQSTLQEHFAQLIADGVLPKK